MTSATDEAFSDPQWLAELELEVLTIIIEIELAR